MVTRLNHCCTELDEYLENDDLEVEYLPKFREYAIAYKAKAGGGLQLMKFCPFCGSNFPPSLRDDYIKIINYEFNFESIFDAEESDELPIEFQSDEWWKKRGL
jgi:hypothetical protein